VAGQTHEVDIGNDDLLPPWSTLFEVVAATDVDQWVLVGGLMVQLHAYRADIPPSRTTKDVDMVVDVVTAKAGIQAVAGQLEAIGFVGREPTAAKHRHIGTAVARSR
jgi:predicted nucleotidyltransferase